MRGLYLVSILLCVAIFNFQCQRETSFSGKVPGNQNTASSSVTAVLQGTITG